MPNQLSRVRPKASLYIESDAITKRPELAPLVAQIIASGSHIETAVTRLLASILSSEQRAVAAMMQSMVNFRAKIDMVTAAIAEKFDEREKNVSVAVFNYVQSAMSQRNKFAHHIIATTEQLPNDILLIEPEAYVEIFTREIDISELANRIEIEAAVSKYNDEPNFDAVWVYKKKDLEEIIYKLRRSVLRLRILDGFLLSDPQWAPVKNEALALLCTEPSIAKAAYPTGTPAPASDASTPPRKSRGKPKRSGR